MAIVGCRRGSSLPKREKEVLCRTQRFEVGRKSLLTLCYHLASQWLEGQGV